MEFKYNITHNFINDLIKNKDIINEIIHLSIEDYHKYQNLLEKSINEIIGDLPIFNLDLYYKVNEKTLLEYIDDFEFEQNSKDQKKEILEYLFEIRNYQFHILYLIKKKP